MSRFPVRAVFPQPSPSVCVTFFSCVGTNVSGTVDLQHTYAAAVNYLEGQPGLPADGSDVRLRYELVWIDNGGDAQEHDLFLGRGAQFETVHRNPTNVGLFRAVNDAWFRGRGCVAPYVLSLEDDRVPRPDLASSRIPHLAHAIELLRYDGGIAGVRLKDEWSDELVSKAAAAELDREDHEVFATTSGVKYLRHCMALTSGFVWGSFSMAAVVYDRERLLSTVGMLMEGHPYDEMPYDYAEGQYAVRVALANLCTARPFFEDACTILDHDNTPLKDPRPKGGPCHQLFIERRAPRERDLDEFKWFFYNTSLQEDGEKEQAKQKAERERTADVKAPSGAAESNGKDDEDIVVMTGCDGTSITRRMYRLFGELDAATRAASASKDYTDASRAFRQLSAAMGGATTAMRAFECAGVSEYYAHFLQTWQPTKSLGGDSAPPPPSRAPTSSLPPTPTPTPKPPPSGASTSTQDVQNPLPILAGGWRHVVPPSTGTQSGIPKIMIQTWRDTASIPQRYLPFMKALRQAHPDWTHLFFDDRDIVDFIRERQPKWMPLYEALVHSPIQRIDLFRYLAVEHFGGFYLDIDIAPMRPFHKLLASPQRCVFPFERIIDPAVHSTLFEHTRTAAMIGQYAFGATPGHRFIRAILRWVRRAASEPEWARVPTPLPGDDDDAKTVHYTTGPAVVTRAFYEGGHLDDVQLLYASPFGVLDPTGWGAFGAYAVHLHAGSWKSKELDLPRLVDRAANHTAAGRHEQAAMLLKRAVMFAGNSGGEDASDGQRMPQEALRGLWQQYLLSHAQSGRPARAYIDIAKDRIATRGFADALRDLDQAAALSAANEDRANVHLLRWLVFSHVALTPEESVIKGVAAVSGLRETSTAAEISDVAARELETAATLDPSNVQVALARVASRLLDTAVHSAEAAPALAHAIVLELRENANAVPTGESLGTKGEDAPAAPHGFAFLPYMWHGVPAMRDALRAQAPIARLLRTLTKPRVSVGRKQCDLEGPPHLKGEEEDDEAAAHAEMDPKAEPQRHPMDLPAASVEPPERHHREHRELPSPRAAPKLAAYVEVDPRSAEIAAGRPRPDGKYRARLLINQHGVPGIDFFT